MKTLIGNKVGMTHIFGPGGRMLPVTVVQAGPCVVTQVKTPEKDGYSAVQLGFGEAKRLNKPEQGHRKAAESSARFLREARITPEDAESFKVGQRLDVTLFTEGDRVDVRGVSKGKGFAGTIKRHGFKRGPKTHGSHNYRKPGSIGAMFPQRVQKGMKMAGRMGTDRTTIKNLEVVGVDPERQVLLIRGAVPGSARGLVVVEGRSA